MDHLKRRLGEYEYPPKGGMGFGVVEKEWKGLGHLLSESDREHG